MLVKLVYLGHIFSVGILLWIKIIYSIHNLKCVCSYLSRDIRPDQLEHTLLRVPIHNLKCVSSYISCDIRPDQLEHMILRIPTPYSRGLLPFEQDRVIDRVYHLWFKTLYYGLTKIIILLQKWFHSTFFLRTLADKFQMYKLVDSNKY